MIIKVCPICKMPKQLFCYSFYFSKSRNKYRPQNYCNDCQLFEKKVRSHKYFETHKEERLQYAKNYRANPANKEKRKVIEQYFKKKYRNELQDCYVADTIGQRMKISATEVRKHPTIINNYRAYIKLKRAIKFRINEEQKN